MATNRAASGSRPMPTTPFDPQQVASPREMARMAAVLEGRHGIHAAEVADFFASLHGETGDPARLWSWAGVAEFIRQRTQRRMNEIG
jgi:hypothetical protein